MNSNQIPLNLTKSSHIVDCSRDFLVGFLNRNGYQNQIKNQGLDHNNSPFFMPVIKNNGSDNRRKKLGIKLDIARVLMDDIFKVDMIKLC